MVQDSVNKRKYKKLKDGTMSRVLLFALAQDQEIFIVKMNIFEKKSWINKLLEMIDKIDMNELGLKVRLEDEVARYSKFQNMMGMINNRQGENKKR